MHSGVSVGDAVNGTAMEDVIMSSQKPLTLDSNPTGGVTSENKEGAP